MKDQNDEDYYFTFRLGIVFILIFLFFNFLGQIARTEPREIISPLPVAEAKEVQQEIPAPKPSKKQPRGIAEMIVEYAEEYQVNPNLMECLIFKESSFNPEAVGDNGLAVGLIQAHPSFWKRYRRQMGEDTDLNLRYDAEESIRTMAYVLSIGGHRSWTAFEWCKGGEL